VSTYGVGIDTEKRAHVDERKHIVRVGRVDPFLDLLELLSLARLPRMHKQMKGPNGIQQQRFQQLTLAGELRG